MPLSEGVTLSNKKGTRVTTELVDADGSFKRFLEGAPRSLRYALSHAVKVTTLAVQNTMLGIVRQNAFLTGEMYRAIEARPPLRRSGLTGRAGIWDEEQAHVGLYNEYRPNHQPFARPAVESEQRAFIRRALAAVAQIERTYKAPAVALPPSGPRSDSERFL